MQGAMRATIIINVYSLDAQSYSRETTFKQNISFSKDIFSKDKSYIDTKRDLYYRQDVFTKSQ